MKQPFVPHNYANDILGNLSRGTCIRIGVVYDQPPYLPRRSLAFANALLPLNWVLRIICIRKG